MFSKEKLGFKTKPVGRKMGQKQFGSCARIWASCGVVGEF